MKTKGKQKAKAQVKRSRTSKKRAFKMEEEGAEWQEGKFFIFINVYYIYQIKYPVPTNQAGPST